MLQEVEVKTEPKVVEEPQSSNQPELLSLLVSEEIVEYVDDDMVITVSEKGFGKPFNTTVEHALIKRQNDTVSGDIAFNENVSW